MCSSTIKRVTQIISWHGHFLCLNSSVFIFMLFFMPAYISLHLCWWLTNHLSRWWFLPFLAHVTTSICLQVFLYFLKRMFLNSTLRWAGDRWHVICHYNLSVFLFVLSQVSADWRPVLWRFEEVLQGLGESDLFFLLLTVSVTQVQLIVFYFKYSFSVLLN